MTSRVAFAPLLGLLLACTAAAPSPKAPAAQPPASVRQLLVEDRVGCLLRDDGTVECWHIDVHGDAAGEARSAPGLPFLVELDLASEWACGRTVDGEVWCFDAAAVAGAELLREILQLESTRVPVPRARQLAIGRYHRCAVLERGGVACWQHREVALLPNVTAVASGSWPLFAVPQGVSYQFADTLLPPERFTGVRQISGRYVLTSDGALSRFKDLGQVERVSMGVDSVAAGDGHVCALDRQRRLTCWGSNRDGQIDPRSARLGFAQPRLVRTLRDDERVEVHAGLTCIVRGPRRECVGRCTALPLGMAACEPRRVPIAEPGLPPGYRACRIEPVDETAPCEPGDFVYGTFGSSCATSCDERGRWVAPKVCINLGSGPYPWVFFRPGGTEPTKFDPRYLAAGLARMPGVFDVVGVSYADEDGVGVEVACGRAAIARRRLIESGVCPEKLVTMAAAAQQDADLRDGMIVGVQVSLRAAEMHEHWRRSGAPLTPCGDAAPR